MPPKRMERVIQNDKSSDDEPDAFSGSDDEPRNNSSSSDSEEERKRKRRKKKKSKKSRKRNYNDSEDEDDPDSSSSSEDERKKSKRKSSKKKKKYNEKSDEEALEKLPKSNENEEKNEVPSKLDIKPLTEEELKEKYRYKRHKCKLSNIPMKKAISGQDACRVNRAAELSVEKVKLHYVVHYINRGIWDHIVPEEGEKEGKIDSYTCNVCSKRFKNYLEKKEYPGRGSALCHVATDHGRLLKAMLTDSEVDMREEVNALARYDRQFNDTFRAYLDQKDDSYVMPDNEIVTVKESLVWKLYAKKHEEKERQKQAASRSENAPKPSEETLKEMDPALAAVLKRSKPKVLRCPKMSLKKDGKKCDESRNEGQSFRLHFFLHYRDQFLSRLDDLEKGDSKTYYCDVCPNKKPNKGATEEGAKTSTICHLAIQHHELRPKVEKDDTLDKEFIADLYYDVDIKKANEELKNKGYDPSAPPVPKPATPAVSKTSQNSDQSDNVETAQKAEKNPKTQTESTVVTPKPGPRSSKKQKMASANKKKHVLKDTNNSVASDNDEDIPDLDENKRSCKKPSSPILKENKEIVRKRRPINFTMADLDLDMEVDEDEEYSRALTPTSTRNQPKRNCSKRKSFQEDKNSDSE